MLEWRADADQNDLIAIRPTRPVKIDEVVGRTVNHYDLKRSLFVLFGERVPRMKHLRAERVNERLFGHEFAAQRGVWGDQISDLEIEWGAALEFRLPCLLVGLSSREDRRFERGRVEYRAWLRSWNGLLSSDNPIGTDTDNEHKNQRQQSGMFAIHIMAPNV